MKKTMRKTKFQICDNERVYEGYTDGSTWNGWECPWFTKEVTEQIMQDLRDDGVETEYNENTDSYSVLQPDSVEDVFEGEYVGTEDGGKHLYPIGAWCWIWDEVVTEKQHFKICISYSWGDEEEPIEFDTNNVEEAFDCMMDLAVKELKTCIKEHKGKYDLKIHWHNRKITLHYGYDNEECYYELLEYGVM